MKGDDAMRSVSQANAQSAQVKRAQSPGKFFKIYLLPPEHGGWFLLLGPFALGVIAAAQPNIELLALLLFALASYIARHPLTLLVKIAAGRRAKSDTRPTLLALGGAGVLAALPLGVLIWRGYAFLLWLGIPAALVLAWQLWLVTQREERQLGIELVGAGMLALAASAAYWVSVGAMTPTGWWLWLLAWLYATASIVYVYLRLKQRRMKTMPTRAEQWRDGRRALLYIGAATVCALAFALARWIPSWAPLAFGLASAHFVYGITHPCVGVKPARIGIEQSFASLGFYALLGLIFAL
ncbi:MAG: hypothetical protein BroJett039_08890 [Chloroflexota bacterium]|nr:MAG: hypothetical protein BroJett039_08890 [Chloroflexota bacterium]